jgi:hypothetical protein
MRGFPRTLIACIAAAAAVTACSDTPTSPRDVSARELSPSGAPVLDISPSLWFSSLRTTTFTLTSAGGKYSIGDGLYTINFPSNSVCDPSVSSYGPGTWDSPCATLKDGQSITVTATYGFTANGLSVDFSPALRFNPTTEVRISTSVYAPILTAFASYFASNPSSLHFLGIYYAPSLSSAGVTDAGFDSSLRTHVNLTTGLVWRRIKHFSGYNITTGLPCDPSPDNPDCVDDGGPMFEQ